MKQSTVYYTDFRVRGGQTLQQKLDRLVETAGLGTLDLEGRFVAIKIHFAEPVNRA